MKEKVFVTVSLDYTCNDKSKPVGYSIVVEDENGRILDEYVAGNAPWESTQRLEPSGPHALSKEKLIQYATQTAEETVEELENEGYKVIWDELVHDNPNDCLSFF